MIDDKRLAEIEVKVTTTRTAKDVRDLIAEVRRLREAMEYIHTHAGGYDTTHQVWAANALAGKPIHSGLLEPPA